VEVTTPTNRFFPLVRGSKRKPDMPDNTVNETRPFGRKSLIILNVRMVPLSRTPYQRAGRALSFAPAVFRLCPLACLKATLREAEPSNGLGES
jgi:hypothetical protein